MSDPVPVAGPSLTAVGLPAAGAAMPSPAARMLYQALVQSGPVRRGDLAALVPQGDGVALMQLLQLGLVRETPGGLVAVPRGQLIEELLAEQAALLQRALDEVMARQRRIRTLLEAGPALDGDGGERISAVPVGDAEDRSLYTLSGGARRDLMAIHPGGRFPAEVLEQSLRRAEASLEAGIRLRVVHQSGALAHRDVVEYLTALEQLGAWVRLRDNVPFRMLVVDREAAVCAAPTANGEDAFVIRGPRVMGLMERVFETVWVDSTPLQAMLSRRRRAVGDLPAAGAVPALSAVTPAGSGQLDDAALAQRYARLTSQQQLVLRYLAEGQTDRMIARRVGITPRTVTRRISEIYAELQVESRFQAGVVAHRLGLV